MFVRTRLAPTSPAVFTYSTQEELLAYRVLCVVIVIVSLPPCRQVVFNILTSRTQELGLCRGRAGGMRAGRSCSRGDQGMQSRGNGHPVLAT